MIHGYPTIGEIVKLLFKALFQRKKKKPEGER